jgi:hypothetical protein
VKRLLSLLVVSFSLSAQAQECIKVDYQELKDFNDKELVAKYCQDKRGFKLNTEVVEFNQAAYETWKTLKDTNGQTRALEKWGVAAQAAKGCKSELDRVLRLLAQKDIDEAKADAQCPVPGLPASSKLAF